MMVSELDRKYPANVFWSDEDEGFIATAPDLPGCSAFGSSQLEALNELEHAIAAWIEAATKAGNPIPAPSRPAVEAQPSGKLLVRMPRALHADLVHGAKRENVSLNQYVVFLLTTGINLRNWEHVLLETHQKIESAVSKIVPSWGYYHVLNAFEPLIQPTHIVFKKVVSTSDKIISTVPHPGSLPIREDLFY